MTAPSFSEELIACVGRVAASPPGPDQGRIASHCLLDWVAACLGGSGSEAVAILHRMIRDERGINEAPLLGFATRGTARQSALLNGTASHVMDLDDVHLQSRVHPSCVVWPAIFALAGRFQPSRDDAFSAFVAGVEMQSRMGRLIGNAHYAKGWHNTATLGTFGATAAAARLLRLDVAAQLNALGLAATMAAGIRASFGTMAKSFHAGRAAEAGLQAALLASAGFTGATDDPLRLYARLTSDGDPSPEDLSSCLRTDCAPAIRQVIFKYSASCYGTHAPIEAATRLSVTPAPGDGIIVEVEPQYLSVCNISYPSDVTEARFSIKSCVALALLGRDLLADESYAEATRDSGPVAQLRDRIEVRAGSDIPRANARLTLLRGDADPVVVMADASAPETDLMRQEARLCIKAKKVSNGRIEEAMLAAILTGDGSTPFADVIKAIET